MKKYHIIIILSLLFCSTILTGCAKKYNIQFESLVYDFGELEEGILVNSSFKFKNTGKDNLIIKDVKVGCSCLVPAPWDKIIPPGEIGQIPIYLKTKDLKGEVIRTIDIDTNVPDKPIIQLTIKGKILEKIPTFVDVAPKQIFLAEIPKNTNKELYGTFQIKNKTGAPISIKDIVLPDVKVQYTINEIEKGEIFKLDFTVYPPFNGTGKVQKSIILKTNSLKQPEIVLPFSYTILP